MADDNSNDVGVVVAAQHTVSGPLPSTTELEGYEKILPGSAERILSLWEKEVAHRHEDEKTITQGMLKISLRGQNYGMIAIIISAVLIALSIILKQPLAAIAPCIISIGSLAAVFFGRKH